MMFRTRTVITESFQKLDLYGHIWDICAIECDQKKFKNQISQSSIVVARSHTTDHAYSNTSKALYSLNIY